VPDIEHDVRWGHPDQWQGRDAAERETALRRRLGEFGAEIREADAALAESGIYPGDPLRPLAERIRELAERAR
jgi:hypothetical protein